jgi:hypothetical protein
MATTHLIYKTTCVITEKFYVGMHSTTNIEDGYVGSGKLLKRSLKKHGKGNHIREILSVHNSREDLEIAERELIEKILSHPKCLNLAKGGLGGNNICWSPERKKRHSELLTGIKRDQAHNEKIRKALTGKPLSEVRRRKISIGLVGKKRSKDSIEKTAAKNTGRSKFLWTIQSPTGFTYEVESLVSFCKDHNLSFSSIYGSQTKGKISRGPSKGWQLLSRLTK